MLYNQKFPLRVIATAFGKRANNLNSDLQQGHLQSAYFSQDNSPNTRSRYSLATAMHFGCAYALVDAFGIKVAKAFSSVLEFAYTGHKDHGILPDRLPTFPYHHDHGDTILLIGSGSCHIIPTENKIQSDCEDYFPHYGNMRRSLRSDHFIVLNVSRVFEQFVHSIGEHPYEVLDSVYRSQADFNEQHKEAAEKQSSGLLDGTIKP